MSRTGLIVDLEEDLGLNKVASENDQRTFASVCHAELMRFELGFLNKLDEDFLVLPPSGIPTRMARREELLSLGSRSDRNPGLCATGFFFHAEGIAAKISMICHVARTRSDNVSDPELTIICQGRYACDVEDVNADFLTMMAAMAKSGICSKARYDVLMCTVEPIVDMCATTPSQINTGSKKELALKSH